MESNYSESILFILSGLSNNFCRIVDHLLVPDLEVYFESKASYYLNNLIGLIKIKLILNKISKKYSLTGG